MALQFCFSSACWFRNIVVLLLIGSFLQTVYSQDTDFVNNNSFSEDAPSQATTAAATPTNSTVTPSLISTAAVAVVEREALINNNISEELAFNRIAPASPVLQEDNVPVDDSAILLSASANDEQQQRNSSVEPSSTSSTASSSSSPVPATVIDLNETISTTASSTSISAAEQQSSASQASSIIIVTTASITVVPDDELLQRTDQTSTTTAAAETIPISQSSQPKLFNNISAEVDLSKITEHFHTASVTVPTTPTPTPSPPTDLADSGDKIETKSQHEKNENFSTATALFTTSTETAIPLTTTVKPNNETEIFLASLTEPQLLSEQQFPPTPRYTTTLTPTPSQASSVIERQFQQNNSTNISSSIENFYSNYSTFIILTAISTNILLLLLIILLLLCICVRLSSKKQARYNYNNNELGTSPDELIVRHHHRSSPAALPPPVQSLPRPPSMSTLDRKSKQTSRQKPSVFSTHKNYTNTMPPSLNVWTTVNSAIVPTILLPDDENDRKDAESDLYEGEKIFINDQRSVAKTTTTFRPFKVSNGGNASSSTTYTNNSFLRDSLISESSGGTGGGMSPAAAVGAHQTNNSTATLPLFHNRTRPYIKRDPSVSSALPSPPPPPPPPPPLPNATKLENIPLMNIN